MSKVIRAGHRQGGCVEGCSAGVICENHVVGSEFSEGMRTHAHILFEYSLGKPLEAKLLKGKYLTAFDASVNTHRRKDILCNDEAQ